MLSFGLTITLMANEWWAKHHSQVGDGVSLVFSKVLTAF
jgi:hypothetical protein